MRARPRRVQKLPGVLALRVILRRNPWAPLAGSLRAGQARGLRSQARFAQGRPVGSARRLASRRAGPWAPLAGSLRALRMTFTQALLGSIQFRWWTSVDRRPRAVRAAGPRAGLAA